MYYLNGRYYNSEWGRFLNSDSEDVFDEDSDSLLQYNLFAYGFNNPVNMHDPDGNLAWFVIPVAYYGYAAIVLGVGFLMSPAGKQMIANAVYGVNSIVRSIASKGSNILQASKSKQIAKPKITKDMKVNDILKYKKGSIKNAPKPKGSPSWEEIQRRAQRGDVGFREIYKLLTDIRFNR